jgi:protein Mpv17
MVLLVFREILAFTKTYPIVRGMVTYAVLWPSSNICQQLIQGREKIDFAEAARFSMFGTFFTAPTLFVWVKLSSRLFPGQPTLKLAIKKVAR